MNKTMIVATLVATLAMPLVANANPNTDPACLSDGNIALGVIEVGGGSADSAFYVDDRNYLLGNGIWVYQESNGVYTAGGAAIDNLQRGGASEIVPDDSEICSDNDPAGPDYLIL